MPSQYSEKKPFFRLRFAALCAALALAIGLGAGPGAAAPLAYVANNGNPGIPGNVSVIDTATNTVVATVAVVNIPTGPLGVAVTPDGSHVYVANNGLGANSVSVIATATNTVVATVPVGSAPAGVAITPDGAHVYVTNGFDGTVSVIATASNTVVATVGVGTNPFGVAVTPDGAHVYVANDDGTVSVIATAGNTVVATIPVGSFTLGVAVTPDGAHVYVTNGPSVEVSVIATATNKVVATIPLAGFQAPFGVAVTPDGKRVYVALITSSQVSVIDTASNTVVGTPIAVGNEPVGVAVTPDGAHVYVANGFDGTVSVIATASNTVVATVAVGTFPEFMGIVPPAHACKSSDATLKNVKFPATGEVTLDFSSPTRTMNSIQLLGSTNIGSFTLPRVVGAHSATGGDFKKADKTKPASFEMGVSFVNPPFTCAIDPTETTLKITTGHEAVQSVQAVPRSEHYVEIDNGQPGLRWVRIEVNGKYARSVSLHSGGTVHVDLSAFMTLDQNTLTFTGEGKAGSFANLDISDSVPGKPKLPKYQEAGTWSRLMLEVR